MAHTHGHAIPHDHITSSTHSDGILLLDAATRTMFASNVVGARIWTALERHMSIEAIATDIATAYGLAHSVAHDDVTQFVQTLADQHLVIVGGA